MNEKFVATNQFIFLEQPAQFYFQITVNTTNTSDYNNGYYFHSHQRWMDGWTQRQGWTNRHIERQIE